MGKEKKKMMVRVMRKREEEERKGMCMYPIFSIMQSISTIKIPMTTITHRLPKVGTLGGQPPPGILNQSGIKYHARSSVSATTNSTATAHSTLSTVYYTDTVHQSLYLFRHGISYRETKEVDTG
jgi:hypothetical protein